jgi:hypothetical protein
MAPRHMPQGSALVTSSGGGCPSPPRSKSPTARCAAIIATISAWAIAQFAEITRFTPGATSLFVCRSKIAAPNGPPVP